MRKNASKMLAKKLAKCWHFDGRNIFVSKMARYAFVIQMQEIRGEPLRPRKQTEMPAKSWQNAGTIKRKNRGLKWQI